MQAKEYQDVWITSGPLWLAVEESQTEEASHPTGPVAETLSTDSGDKESNSKKRRKVRPPRPATLRMTYQVIGPNKVSVPTHLYKVLVYCRLLVCSFSTQVIVVSDPSLEGPQHAAFVVPNEPVQDRHLTEFQVLSKLGIGLGGSK